MNENESARPTTKQSAPENTDTASVSPRDDTVNEIKPHMESKLGNGCDGPTKRITASEILKLRVSMFANAYGVEPKEIELGSIFDEIRNGSYAKEIHRVRILFAKWKTVCPNLDNKESPEAKAYEKLKKKLPAFCMSGTAKNRKEPLEHSGLLQIDCDKLKTLNGELGSLREKLKADKYIAFCGVSPSGEGLKAGLVIDGNRHEESFEAAQRYFRETYGVKIDPRVKDRLRLCFVSHDPELWIGPEAEQFPISEKQFHPSPSLPLNEDGASRVFYLPSGNVSISDSARAIFQRIARTRTLFWRGGAIVEIVEHEGVANLEIVKPDAFRSRVERYGKLVAWRLDGKGSAVLKPTKMPRDDAAAIMAAAEARELLPPIASVLRCPVLIESGQGEATILGRGYHSELGGLLIVAGDEPPRVPIAEAVASIKSLVEQSLFQSDGDRSRALAAFITPALRMGGFLNRNVPIDVAEADDSQAGKGHRQSMVPLLYNETAYPVTQRDGGVGSFDESFGAALAAGRPFITLENVRGRVASQHIEGFLTSPEVFNGLFVARVPGMREQTVNSRRFLIQLSSNGLESTIDLANRASICRIRKRRGFTYRDIKEELQRRQSYYLGCVFAIIEEWLAHGKPRTKDTRHDFREWSQTLDWIVQNILGCAPLMDGHQEAQTRVSNPALSWLRTLAMAVERESKLGCALIASELAELCQVQSLEIPGLKGCDEDPAKRQIGILMRRVFNEKDEVNLDEYAVKRGDRDYRKPSGDLDSTPAYTFTK